MRTTDINLYANPREKGAMLDTLEKPIADLGAAVEPLSEYTERAYSELDSDGTDRKRYPWTFRDAARNRRERWFPFRVQASELESRAVDSGSCDAH